MDTTKINYVQYKITCIAADVVVMAALILVSIIMLIAAYMLRKVKDSDGDSVLTVILAIVGGILFIASFVTFADESTNLYSASKHPKGYAVELMMKKMQ